MNGPMILPWIAHKAGISEARAEELWREALCYATEQTGWVGTSDYWEAAEQRLHKLIEREVQANSALRAGLAPPEEVLLGCLPKPELSAWVRLQSRMAHLPLLLAESWSVAWVRLLSPKTL